MVMHEGEMMGTLDRADATQERVMHLASGNSIH
jgi:inositol transport system ATP-binding protein